jgi:hypothetical protein
MGTSPSVYTERADQLQDQRWKDQRDVQLAPLQESLRADQTRLALYANPDDPTKPLAGKENEYNATHERMAQTIGQMRQLYGQKPGGANPVEAALGNVADKLHITNHLKNHVAQARADAEAKYQFQNQQMAESVATGALPFTETPAGQAETKKAADAQALEAQRATAAQNVENTRAQAQRDVANTRQTTEGPYKQAQLDFKNAQLRLNQAKFQASQDPKSPQNVAALLRAQQEATRSQAYMLRAQAGAMGTYNGKALPGATETTEGTPIGSMFSSNYFKSQQGLAQLNDAYGSIKSVDLAVKNLYDSGSGLNHPAVAQALANPEWTANKLLQGIAAKSLTPEESNAVIAIKSAQENIQGMRKAAGGGLSNEQVNRLEAQIPGANTPNYAYAQTQLGYLNTTLGRLAEGVPETVGGETFHGERPTGPKTKQLHKLKSGGKLTADDLEKALAQ